MIIALLTSGRQDWGILRSTALALQSHASFDLRVICAGPHASELEADDVRIAEQIDWAKGDVFEQTGRALTLVGAALSRQNAQALILIGDRFETAAAALAASVARIPIIHLHGGEETLGAFDDAFRHAITKLSHLHFVSHANHRSRLLRLGEDVSTIHVVGAPGLDNANRSDLPARGELERELGLPLKAPLVLVSVHATTLAADPLASARAVIAAMDAVPATYVITAPNLDPDSDRVRALLEAAAKKPGRVFVPSLGARRYWGMLRLANAIIGNSSSALIEAPVCSLRAINVGARQQGRLRSSNVVDVPDDAVAVAAELRIALQNGRAAKDHELGDGHAAKKIINILEQWRPPVPPRKLSV
jgi:UDP-hydrolysing UDP-N-acetyl-D-glucosamine 2-epimerase